MRITDVDSEIEEEAEEDANTVRDKPRKLEDTVESKKEDEGKMLSFQHNNGLCLNSFEMYNHPSSYDGFMQSPFMGRYNRSSGTLWLCPRKFFGGRDCKLFTMPPTKNV